MIIKEINLPIQNVLFWTDSILVLQYLRNQRHRFKVCVPNRVMDILEMTTASQWHHIGSKQNPDICSRRVAIVHELSNETGSLKSWYKGPNFLWSNSKVEAKLKGSKIEDLDENNEEIKTKCCFTNKICKVEPFIKFGIYSSWKRLCHILSYVKRFMKNCRTEGNNLVGTLAAHEIKGARQDLIKLIQQECFAEEYELLRTKQEIRSGKLKDLHPLMDKDGLIRVGGRLKHANIPYDWKPQVNLPKDHHISELIAREYHNHSHQGTEYLLANLRKKYWIIQGRVLVNQVIKKCITCQRKRAKNLKPKEE